MKLLPRCCICQDPRRIEIETDYISNSCPIILEKYGISKATFYRHLKHSKIDRHGICTKTKPDVVPYITKAIVKEIESSLITTHPNDNNAGDLIRNAITWVSDARDRAVVLADCNDYKAKGIGISLILRSAEVACRVVERFQAQEIIRNRDVQMMDDMSDDELAQLRNLVDGLKLKRKGEAA